jgi:maltooligosyltrehalose trehalohydrolase
MRATRGARLGAHLLGEGRCSFLVWAPRIERVEVHLLAPEDRILPLAPLEDGYHGAILEPVEAGARYRFRLDGTRERPDPASRLQPEGVHGPSQVVDPGFDWSDRAWRGLPREALVFYELHTGTFSPEGSFAGIERRLDALVELGVTAIELMPVCEFSGARNWGYDGTYLFAAHHAYGGPAGLKRLVDGCHRRGLAAILDVVYNHLGPEGNYLWDFGPYFTDRYRTPWGQALNFDGPGSDEVRRFFLENALGWLEEHHLDGLRLDAVHGIADRSAVPFLEELAIETRALEARLGRQLHLIPESDLNDARLIRPRAEGGHGLDAQWSDDLHHALHALLTPERDGYYQDFGELAQLAKALREGYVYTGERSRYRGRRHGNSAAGRAPSQFVVFAQNHDQVGNRIEGERLSTLVPFEAQQLAACTVLLSPFLPLLFMGEEYGETAPFLYFVSHGDPELCEAVRRGRREEAARFGWRGELPDPAAEASFLRSKLDPGLAVEEPHRRLLALHRELLRLRRSRPALGTGREPAETVVLEAERVLILLRRGERDQALVISRFADRAARVRLPLPAGSWRRLLDTSDPEWCPRGTADAARAPERVSGGELELELGAFACLVYGSEAG